MQRALKTTILLVGLIALALNIASYAQQHDHAAQEPQSKSSVAQEQDIFCSTMKTGQLCSHGTASVLGLAGAKQEKWMELARKYNKTVDAATLQLFKDAESVLTPEQLTQLKAWFAVGLNPQINQILFSQGLGPQKK